MELFIYGAVMAVVLWFIFVRKPKDEMTEKEDVALFFASELTNAVWLMTKEQYADQLKKWDKAYGGDTRMGDALVKESFDLAECFMKELKERRKAGIK